MIQDLNKNEGKMVLVKHLNRTNTFEKSNDPFLVKKMSVEKSALFLEVLLKRIG